MAKVLILGAGGIGGYFGGRLLEAGGDVTFLVRAKRQQILAQHGLRVESPAGNLTLAVNTVTDSELANKINDGITYDYVFLTAKAYDLASAITSIRPAMGKNTVLIPALNGMAHMDRLNSEFDKNNVMAGCVIIQSTLTSDGVVLHLNDDAVGILGPQQGGKDARATAFARLFDNAKGIKVIAVENAMQRMWNKWVRLATLAGMTCLMRANVGEINRAPGGQKAMMSFLNKNSEIAKAAGFPLLEDQTNDIGNFFKDINSFATASMLRDIEAGHQTEGDHVLGDLLNRAKTFGVDHPLLSLAYTNVKAYDERRLSGRDKRK